MSINRNFVHLRRSKLPELQESVLIPESRMTRQGRQQAMARPPSSLENLALLMSGVTARQVITDTQKYLEPVLSLAHSPPGCNTACSQRTAKLYFSFVVQLLKTSMAQITLEQAHPERIAAAQLAAIGLEALSVLRGSLKGKLHEVEVQRYMLVRKLVLFKSYSDAVHQAWLLYTALSCQCWQPAAAILLDCDGNPAQSLPKADRPSNTEIASLVSGTVRNLLLSIVEQGTPQSDMSKVATLVNDYEAIMSWLRLALLIAYLVFCIVEHT